MNENKYNLSAGVIFQDERVITIDLGNFDTIKDAREAALKHKNTVNLEFGAEIIYDTVEITNYGTNDENWETIDVISVSIDEETSKEVIDTTSNPSKELCQKIVNGLPSYKVFVSYCAADCQEHEIEGEQIDEYIERSFFLTMTIDDEKKEIHIHNITYAEMQV